MYNLQQFKVLQILLAISLLSLVDSVIFCVGTGICTGSCIILIGFFLKSLLCFYSSDCSVIRILCLDCLRLQKEFKVFDHISFTWMNKWLSLSSVSGNYWSVYHVNPALFYPLVVVFVLQLWRDRSVVRLGGRYCLKLLWGCDAAVLLRLFGIAS